MTKYLKPAKVENPEGDYHELSPELAKMCGYSYVLFLVIAKREWGERKSMQCILTNKGEIQCPAGDFIEDSYFIFNDKIKRLLEKVRGK